MITIKFSTAFQAALRKRVEAHQELINTILKGQIEQTYRFVLNSIKYNHANDGTWKLRLNNFFDPGKLSYCYQGEVIDRDIIHGWITGKNGHGYIGYRDLCSRVSNACHTYEFFARDKHYQRALMLLKYCGSFETVTVPVDFLLWFEK